MTVVSACVCVLGSSLLAPRAHVLALQAYQTRAKHGDVEDGGPSSIPAATKRRAAVILRESFWKA